MWGIFKKQQGTAKNWKWKKPEDERPLLQSKYRTQLNQPLPKIGEKTR